MVARAFSYEGFTLGKLGEDAVATWIDESGTRRRYRLGVPFSPRAAAQAALIQFAQKNRRDALDAKGALFSDVWAQYEADRLKDGKKHDAIVYPGKRLKTFFGSTPVDQITQDMCREYAKHQFDVHEYSAWSVWTDLCKLASSLNWARDNRIIDQLPPLWNVKTPKGRDRVLTKQEFDALLDQCTEPHMRLFVTIALYTTARTSAILELTWDRVDFTKGEIRFSTGEQSVTNITDKGFQKGRATVHMTDTLRAVLSHARDSATSRYVIAYRGRGGLGSIMTGWQAARERAGLGPDVTPHVLRHTGATWLANEGVPVESVSKLLGHAKIDTTRLYQHSDSSPTKQAAEALERGAQKGLRVVK